MRAPSRWTKSLVALAMAAALAATAGPARAETCPLVVLDDMVEGGIVEEVLEEVLYLEVCFDETSGRIFVAYQVVVGTQTIGTGLVELHASGEDEEVFLTFLNNQHTYVSVNRWNDPETGERWLTICVKTMIGTEPVERCRTRPAP